MNTGKVHNCRVKVLDFEETELRNPCMEVIDSLNGLERCENCKGRGWLPDKHEVNAYWLCMFCIGQGKIGKHADN